MKYVFILITLHLTGRQPPNKKAFRIFLLDHKISLILRQMYSLNELKPGFIGGQKRRLELMEINSFAFWRQTE